MSSKHMLCNLFPPNVVNKWENLKSLEISKNENSQKIKPTKN
jgi:hypothetical protein